MLNRLGVLPGPTGSSKTPISGIRCAKLDFYVKTTNLATVDESRGEPGNGRPNIFGDFRRAILWGGYGGVPGSIGGLGSA